jgi:hypothetical protein
VCSGANKQFAIQGNVIANNQLGEVRIPIRRAGFPVPTITAHPNSATASTGSSQSLTVAATGESLAYAWKKNGAIISGATSSTFILTNISASDAGSYTVTVTNSGGSVTSNAATLTVLAPNLPPTVTTSPAALTVVAGAKSTLSVTAAGTAPFTYQWLRNGTAIPGATSTTLTLDSTLVSDAGAYSVRITNSVSTITSAAATLSVTPISRISNLSVLTSLSDPTDNFTLGYVIGGANTTGAKPLVLRAAGPALAALGVGGTVEVPKLELFAGPTKTGENDNWAGASTLTSAFTAVGAFPFASPTSRDAAVATALTTRDNSVKISAANSGTGGRDFDYGDGPTFRFVAALGDAGFEAYNVIPGGQSGLVDSDVFSDQAKLWLGNEAIPVPLEPAAVAAQAVRREVFGP